MNNCFSIILELNNREIGNQNILFPVQPEISHPLCWDSAHAEQMIDHMIHSNSLRRELIRINIKLPDCVSRHKIKKSLGFSTEHFCRITSKTCENEQL